MISDGSETDRGGSADSDRGKNICGYGGESGDAGDTDRGESDDDIDGGESGDVADSDASDSDVVESCGADDSHGGKNGGGDSGESGDAIGGYDWGKTHLKMMVLIDVKGGNISCL